MNQQDDRTQFISGLARAMHDTLSAEDTVKAIFAQSVELLPDVTDISITARRGRGTFDSLGSSSPMAAQADRLQYELGQGPCVEAASPNGEGLLREGDLRSSGRWPQWGPGAADLGAGSIISIALLARGEPYGAINMYSRESGAFRDADEVALAQLWASHAAAALSAARHGAGLHTAISTRHTIGMAQGIVMERFGLGVEDSFRVLTRLASQLERRVVTIAAEVVETREIPTE